MNAGLSNLYTLKQHLLAGILAEGTDYDLPLAAIGKGIAGLFETFCNRRFAYAAGETIIFPGDTTLFYLPRYPVVSVTKVETRYLTTDAWTTITGQPISTNPETGLLDFGFSLGRSTMARVTWTGGFWFETLEPTDVGYPSATPAAITGSTDVAPSKFTLPDDLKAAWLIECQEVWNKRDKLGIGIAELPDKRVALEKLDMIPIVKTMLQPYKRYQLS